MSPRTTFQSCGSSSRLSLRSTRLTRVIRGSPSLTAYPAPTRSAPTIIVRSLSSSKSTPSIPTRVCRYSTGPPSSSLTASAESARNGLATTSPAPAIATSRARFRTTPSARPLGDLPRRGHAAAQVVPEREHGRPRDEDVVARDADAERGREQEEQLGREHHRVHPAVRGESDRGAEQDDVQQPGRVAEVPVRDQLDEVPERLAAQHLPPQDDQPAVLEHAHLAPELRLVRRRRLLRRDRVRLVDRAPATLDEQVGEREVVAEPRVDFDVVAPPQGVDRPEAAGRGVQQRLLRAQ